MANDVNYSAGFLAKVWDVSERYVQRLAKEGVIPKVGRGRYPLIAATSAYIRHLRERALGAQADAPLDYAVERAGLIKAQREKVELELKIARGELIPRETVERVQDGMIGAFRSRILSIPSKTAPILASVDDPGQVQQIQKEHLHEALNELADYDPEHYGVPCVPEGVGDSPGAD